MALVDQTAVSVARAAETTRAASLATTTVVVMVGVVCVVSGQKNALVGTESGSWRDQSKRCQQACERGSADVKWAGKER